MTETRDDFSATIPIVEEHATIAKRGVVTGKVRVSTHTETKTELVTASLSEDTVSVERVAINRPIDAVPPIRTEGEVTIVPVVEEVLVVEKRLVLVEEVHIRRTVSQQTVQSAIELRQQRAVVERLNGSMNKPEQDEAK